MVTIVMQPVSISAHKKNATKYAFSMVCYFDDFLFRTWNELFPTVQDASHYAEGFLMEQMIDAGSVETVIENYNLISTTDLKRVSINGLPYSVFYKSKGKYKTEY